MVKESSELRNIGGSDRISTATGGERGSLEKYSGENFDTAGREFDSDVNDAPGETVQIKAQIQETRSQMGETIDAIQERLSFANISEQVSETVNHAIETAKDTAYDATIGKAVNFMKDFGDGVTNSGTFKTVRSNPFPFALIGLGAGLLVYQSYNRSDKGRDGRRSFEGRGELNRAALASASRTSAADTTGGMLDGVTDRANAALGSVTNAAGTAYEGVTSAAGTAYEGVTGAVSTAYTGAGDLANKAYDRAGEFGTVAYEKYDEYLEENPLALGALAVAVGAAVGFAIPSTQYEGKLMGEARENLVQRAQDAAGSLVDKAKQVATEAGQTIKHETRALTQ